MSKNIVLAINKINIEYHNSILIFGLYVLMTLLLCNNQDINMPHLPSPFTIFAPPLLQNLNSIFWNYNNTKFSFPQISHRADPYININNQSQQLIKTYFQVPQNYAIIYLPNEAAFSAVPFNLNGLVNNNSIYLVNDFESEFAYKQSLKINDKTLRISNLSQRSEIASKSSSKFYTFYSKVSLETGKVQGQLQPLQQQILVCNLNYCSHFEQLKIQNHGVVFFESGRGFGLTGMTVVIVRKDLLGLQLPNCPDMMCFEKSVTAKSVINTPYTFVPLLFAEYIKYCSKQNKGLGQVGENLKRIKKEYVQALEKKTKVIETSSNGIIVFAINECSEDLKSLGWKFGNTLSIMLQEENEGKAQQFVQLLFK